MKTLNLQVIIYKDRQFPLTILDRSGFNIAELPLCEKTLHFFGLQGFDRETKRITVTCQDYD